MTTEFTSLSASNIELFATLYIAVFNSPPWNDGWQEPAVRERLSTFAAHPKFGALGALGDGAPVALVLGWGERWTQGWHFHIKEMCVLPAEQRKGLGSKLLSEFETRLTAMGYTNVYLETGRSASARLFYERHGYRDLSLISLGRRLKTQ